jgi:hypothetical protein
MAKVPPKNGAGKAPAIAVVDVLLRTEEALRNTRRRELAPIEASATRALTYIIAALANDDGAELSRLERAGDAYLKDFKPAKNPRHWHATARFGDPNRHTITVGAETFHFGQAGFSFSRNEAMRELARLAKVHSLAIGRRTVPGLTSWIVMRWLSLGIGRPCPSPQQVQQNVEHELSRLERLGHIEDPWRIAGATLVAALHAAGLESFEGKPARKQAESWLRAVRPEVEKTQRSDQTKIGRKKQPATRRTKTP